MNTKPYLETCPVGCNAPLQATALMRPEGVLRRCTACGQLLSQCSEAQYWHSMQEFDDAQGTLPLPADEARRFALGKKRLDKVARMLGKPPQQIHLLDVGCSSGAFLRVARELGFQAEGVEPAPQAAQTTAAAGFKVYQGLLQDAHFPDAAFDAITLFEVIEHLREPLALLRECRRILRPSGVMMIGTGNAASWTVAAQGGRWEYFSIARHGGHVSFFNPDSLRLAAQRSGFRVARIETRCVRLCDKGACARLPYTLAKIGGELLNAPARLFGKGHDMLALLR